MNEHPLCCDCLECMGPGVKLRRPPLVRVLGQEDRWQLERRRRQRRDAQLRWQKRHPQAAQAVKRRCWEKNRDKYNATRNVKQRATRAMQRERAVA